MPRRKRYALPTEPPPFTEYERSVSIQEDFVQPSPAETQLVASLTDDEGLDPVERKGRGVRYKTDAERAEAVMRVLPHRSTINGAMAAIHERRFAVWLMGMSYDDIAELEDVDNSMIMRSVAYSKSLLSREEVFRANAQHTANRAHEDCADDVSPAISALLQSSSWKAKSAGLTQFRRTVGMEVAAGVNVMVDNRRQTAIMNGPGSQPQSFEEVMDRVRGKLIAEQETKGLIAAPSVESQPQDVVDAEITNQESAP